MAALWRLFAAIGRAGELTTARVAVAAAFAALLVHTLLYAAFLEDPLTWALLALGTGLAAAVATRPADAEAEARAVRRAERVVGAGLLAAAVLWWLLVPSYPNYDAYYHLVWGREILDGLKPSFEAYAAPTQHPLYVAYAALVGLAGEDADRLLVLTTLLCLVALVWGTWRLGLALFGVWPALLATVFVGSSFAFLLYAVRAYVDVPFLALVVWAAASGRRRARRGAAGLLVFAGLLRPEGWILAGLLWLWRWPAADTGRRVRGALLVLVAPVVWCLVDLVVTGNPLHSVTATSSLAEDLGRERGIAKVPRLFVTQLADVARPPVALAGVIGAVLAVRRFGPRAMAIPLAMLGAGVLAFIGTGVLGLSILPALPHGPRGRALPLRRLRGRGLHARCPPGTAGAGRGARAAVGALVVGAVFLVVKLGSFGTLADELRFGREMHDDLRRAARHARGPGGHGAAARSRSPTTGSCPTRAGCSTRRAPTSAPAARAAATAGSPSSPWVARRCAATGSRTARAR